jgi:hypothetical protein
MMQYNRPLYICVLLCNKKTKMRKPLLITIALLTVSIVSSAQVPSYVPANGLVGWWPFNGNANDVSGNGNNGTVYGATLTTDRKGNANSAYSFNGTSNYIQISTGSTSGLNATNGSYSISLWFMSNWSSAINDMALFWRGDNAPAADAYMLMIPTTQTAVFRRDVSSGQTSNVVSYSLSSYTSSNYHHLVGVYDSATSKMTLYIDGMVKTQQNLPGTIFYSTSNFVNVIGAVSDYVGYLDFFSGKLDDIGFWKRALTDCEVRKLYDTVSTYVAAAPANQGVLLGNNAVFTVTSSLSSGATYQWQIDNGTGFINLSNAGQYSGVTTGTLTVSNITPSNNNQLYRCIVGGAATCRDTSASAKLTISNLGVAPVEAAGYLAQNVPNPAKGQTEINYYIPQIKSGAALTVCDMQGRTVNCQSIAHAGRGSIIVSGLPAGVYCYYLTVDDSRAAVKRMLVE